ncbi:MAG: hypothetical protein AB1424_01690 [Thermodesulfobacteriota bacterium]
MGEQEKQDIRWVRLEEIKLSRLYKELVPRPADSDRQLLKESIAERGFDPAHSLVLNMDMLLLDGYNRHEIGQELKKEWVPVVFRDYGGSEGEQEFIILAAAARRHLTSGQLAFMGLKLLEIEERKAKDRQRAGQDKGRLHRLLLSQASAQDAGRIIDCEDERPETQELSEVGLSNQLDKPAAKGAAIKLAAKKIGASHETIRQAKVISEAAKTNPEIAKDVDEVKAGKKKIKVVYAKVKSWREEKKEHQQRMDEEDQALEVPREELMETLREAARIKNMPMPAVEALMESDPQFLQVWKHIRLGLVTLTVGWCVIYWKIHVWLRAQQGLEPDKNLSRMIFLEKKKSLLVFLMQFALRMLKVDKVPEIMVECITGIDRKLFPYMYAWEDRLDLLAERLRISSRLRPEVIEKARLLWAKGKKDDYRNLITLSIMGDHQKKLMKEEELERQRFGRH